MITPHAARPTQRSITLLTILLCLWWVVGASPVTAADQPPPQPEADHAPFIKARRAGSLQAGIAPKAETSADAGTLIDTYSAAYQTSNLYTITASPRIQLGAPLQLANAGSYAQVNQIRVFPTNHSYSPLTFTQLEVRLWLWNAWNGASNTAVFEQPAQGTPYTILINGNYLLPGGMFLDVTIPFDPPLIVPTYGLGYAVSFRADYGQGLIAQNTLAPLLVAFAPFSVGSVLFPSPNYGYYRNTSGQTSGNFNQNESRFIGIHTAPAVIMTGSPYTPGPRVDSVGVYHNGAWYLRDGPTGNTPIIFGDPADLPVAGDWDGDSIDSISLYRTSAGMYYLNSSNTAPVVFKTLYFGNPGDTPLAGRWDSTMTRDGVGVYRDSNGILYLRRSLDTGFSDYFMIFGNPGDVGIAGDWNGDGFDSVGVYRPSEARWYLTNVNGNGVTYADYSFPWSVGGLPMVGDWDGNQTSTPGYRAPTGAFILHTVNAADSNAADLQVSYGPAGGRPVAGKWTNQPTAPNQPLKPPSILVAPGRQTAPQPLGLD